MARTRRDSRVATRSRGVRVVADGLDGIGFEVLS